MNTAVSCRDFAASNRRQALAEPLASRRAIFEASAKAWGERADTLDRIGRTTVARFPSHREVKVAEPA